MVRHVYTEDDVAEAILDITDRGLSQGGGGPETWSTSVDPF
jgi:hypothetical protein